MQIGISKILESNASIAKQIMDALADSLTDVLKLAAPKIKIRYTKLLDDKLKLSPEYSSLTNSNGVLRRELGVEHAQKIDDVVQIWVQSLRVVVTPVVAKSNSFDGGLIVRAIDSEYGDVLTSSSSTQITSHGQVLPWLEWLLLEGRNYIVDNYEVRAGNYPKKISRTGQAIMVKSKRSWRVPEEFAGTRANNWITRVIRDMNEDEVLSIIQEEILRVM